MDSKLREAEALAADDGSGKKKSKFKNFKKFFVIKKRKEALPSFDNTLLKPSQSTSDVTTHESLRVDDDSEDESGSHMGSRALSHDSIFIPDTVQEPARPGRVFSQENVSDRIRTLQMKLQNTIIMGPPPLRIPSKRMDDAGASSEDDGLPRSPPEMSLMQEALNTNTASRFSDTYKRLSSLSLAGTGSEEEEQISPGPSSRPLSPVGQPILRPTSSRTISPQRSESQVSPSADFSSPPQFATCLDNSAAKYRLSIKPRNQRSSKARKASLKSLSDSLNDLSCTPEEEEVEESGMNDVVEVFAMDGIGSMDQEMEDGTQTKSGISDIHGLIMHRTTSQNPGETDNLLAAGAIVKTVSKDDLNCEQNVLTGTVTLEAEQHIHSGPLAINEGSRSVKDHLKAHEISVENVLASAMKIQTPNRKSHYLASSVNDTSPTKKTPGAISQFTPFAETSIAVDTSASLHISPVEGSSSMKETPAEISEMSQFSPKKSSGKHLDNLHLVNKPTFPVSQASSSSLFKVGSTSCPPEKSKSDQPPQASIKETSQTIGHSGTLSESKGNVIGEVGALRKFSVSSAWDRPKTGSFNLKLNSERGSQLSVKSLPSKCHIPISGSEKHKEDAEHFSESQDEKRSSKKQECSLDAEPKSEEKMADDCEPHAPNAAVAVTDTVGHSECQSEAKDQNPFQVKLRATSSSLRYRAVSSTAVRSNKRHSAEFKVEKETQGPISKEYVQTKKNDFTEGTPLTELEKSKAKSTENLDARPPLPRKPAPHTKMASVCTANIENQENNSRPTESRAETKEEEKRSSFYKLSEENSGACGDEFVETEKGVLSPVNALETAKGPNSPSEPTWMSRVKRKPGGIQEQPLNLEEKLTHQEGKAERGLQEKNKDHAEVSPKQAPETMQCKNSPSAAKVTSEESTQYGKNEPKETRRRAHTLSHPIPVIQPSLPAEKETKTQTLRSMPADTERPSWMDLAKKKSQAWNDMPQIIK